MSQSKPQRRSLLKELGLLAAFLSVSDLTLSGLIVAVIGYFDPNPIPGFRMILAVFITTLPLTLAIAIIMARYKGGSFDAVGASITIIVAALISDLLNLQTHLTLLQASNIPVGPTNVAYLAAGILGIYWSRYGPLLFIKSLVLGVFLGLKYRSFRR